jgi:uncharacterized protein (TIGR04255 family)
MDSPRWKLQRNDTLVVDGGPPLIVDFLKYQRKLLLNKSGSECRFSCRENMAKQEHLKNAPVIEAIFGIQADASKNWDAETVEPWLLQAFSDFPQIQEQRQFVNEISLAPGKKLKSNTSVRAVEAFLLRQDDGSSAIQVRRDGFSYSQLAPYPDWEKFVAAGLQNWEIYRDRFEVSSPHNVFVRFVSRVSYPKVENFRLSDYFVSSPSAPDGTDWTIASFRDNRVYFPHGSKFKIESNFWPTGTDKNQDVYSFILDLSVTPTQTLAESGETIDEILPHLRDLKNDAFFSKFTEQGIQPYR